MSICHPTEEQKKILSHWVSIVLTAMYYKNNAAQCFHHLLCFPMSLSTYLFWPIYNIYYVSGLAPSIGAVLLVTPQLRSMNLMDYEFLNLKTPILIYI